MSRKMIGIMTALLFLLGVMTLCWTAADCVLKRKENSQSILAFREKMDALEPASIRKQRNLARWYNVSLGSQAHPENLADAYENILSFGDGVLGYMYMPRTGAILPIYHSFDPSAPGDCLVHLAESALPVGGLGNHTVLKDRRVNGTLRSMDRVQEGDYFYIYILGDVLVYEVVQIREVAADGAVPRKDPEADICTLTAHVTRGLDTVQLQTTGKRLEREQEQAAVAALRAPAAVDRRIVAAALGAAIAAGLLPAAARLCTVSANWLKDIVHRIHRSRWPRCLRFVRKSPDP